jgi:hypothetical protein
LARRPSLETPHAEGGVERALVDLERVARELANALGQSPAVERSGKEALENQQIERALEELTAISRHVKSERV